MTEVAVTFPDVEELATSYLAAQLPADTTYVGTTKPQNMAGRQVVVVRRDGGPQLFRTLMAATVVFRVFAPDDGAATDLALLVCKLIYALQDIAGSGVSAVEILSGPTPVTDDSLIPCRYFSTQLYIRGS